MVVRNPSIQRETHVMQPKDDPFLKTLNAGEEYSMLCCPGKWTLAVKEYMVLRRWRTNRRGWGRCKASLALEKARRASRWPWRRTMPHELAKTLTQLNFDAYVLHTRTSSVVSIGAFNGPNDPAMQNYRDRIVQLRRINAQAQTDPSKKDPLGLYPVLVPVEAPHFQ